MSTGRSSWGSKGGFLLAAISLSTFLVWVSCWLICSRDIRHGIERASVVFMPVLFLLTIIMVLWSVSLDGVPGTPS